MYNDSSNNNNSSNVIQNQIDRISDNLPEYQTKEEIDVVLDKWKKNYNGQPKELLILLSTLHEVWSKEEKLKDISLKELTMDNKLASSVYKKCMLLFHDDKIKNLSPKYKLAAKALYYILTDANKNYRDKN